VSNKTAVFFSWLVTILVPLAIIMFSARLLMTPVFLEVEYRMPGFPEDNYGFTQQDRLKWAKPSVEYLINSAEINYLADLKFDNGQPIYNERELSHMADVKAVVQKLLRVWVIDLILLVLFGLWAWRMARISDYLSGLRRGGYLTAGLLLALAGFASISFWQFFSWFHSLFFSGDSWLFLLSDTLIRLFPIRFWQDAVIFIVGFSMLAGVLLGVGLKRPSKP
jgi:integral membrane protein (TIGR01906 family)